MWRKCIDAILSCVHRRLDSAFMEDVRGMLNVAAASFQCSSKLCMWMGCRRVAGSPVPMLSESIRQHTSSVTDLLFLLGDGFAGHSLDDNLSYGVHFLYENHSRVLTLSLRLTGLLLRADT